MRRESESLGQELESLGEEVREALRELPDDARIDAGRQRLVDALAAEMSAAAPTKRHWLWWMAPAFAVAASLLLFWLLTERPRTGPGADFPARTADGQPVRLQQWLHASTRLTACTRPSFSSMRM